MAGTASFGDVVAAHLSTVWDTATGDNPKPTIDNYIDDLNFGDAKNAHKDMIWVHYTGDTYDRGGWAHQNETYTATIIIRATTKDGVATNVKERLVDIKDQVLHSLHYNNHPITGYTFHFAPNYRMQADHQAAASGNVAVAWGRVSFIAFKHAQQVL